MPAHEVYLPRARTVAPTALYDEDVETLRRGYAAFAAGDIPAVLELFDPQIDWYTPDTVVDGGRTPAAPAAPEADPIDRLKKLEELRAAGIVTDEEFAEKKAQILSQL